MWAILEVQGACVLCSEAELELLQCDNQSRAWLFLYATGGQVMVESSESYNALYNIIEYYTRLYYRLD